MSGSDDPCWQLQQRVSQQSASQQAANLHRSVTADPNGLNDAVSDASGKFAAVDMRHALFADKGRLPIADTRHALLANSVNLSVAGTRHALVANASSQPVVKTRSPLLADMRGAPADRFSPPGSGSQSPVPQPEVSVTAASGLLAERQMTPILASHTDTTAITELGLSTNHPTPMPLQRALPAPATVMVALQHPPEAPAWKQEFSQQIALLSRQGVHSAEIRLHPESLGSLQISLRMQQEQAQIHIVSEHAGVRQAIEQALPQLRAAMAESGVQLGQASVGSENPHANADGQRGSSQPPSPDDADDHLAGEDESTTELIASAPGNSYGINTFV
ncbi:flagellar hook-length control protein FliK [Erwinia sp. S63]|nr:flagellar hook-length control protein FliK [Erwinia sp. S63]